MSHYAFLPDTLHAAHDVKAVEGALQQQAFDQIHTLLDARATKSEILALLNKNDLEAGQTLVILLAGHGTQISDDEDPDHEPDRLDEAYVPYDGVLGLRSSLLTDDEIHHSLNALRLKLGEAGELLLLVDACYGGGMARTIRYPYTRGFPMSQSANELPDHNGWQDFAPGLPPSGMAPLVIICASQPNELSFEIPDESGQLIGPLSWSFCHALAEIGKETDYSTLFQRVQSWMYLHAKRQSPLILGNADRKVFGGSLRAHPIFLQVIDTARSIVNGGTIAGWQVGDTVGLFPPGTHDPLAHPPAAIGWICQSAPFTSQIDWLGRKPNRAVKAAYWVLPLRPTAKSFCLPFCASCDDDRWCASFSDRLMASHWLAYDTRMPDLRLIARAGKWWLQDARGQVFWEGGPADSLAALDAIRRFAIHQAMAGLSVRDLSCAADIRLFRCDAECQPLPAPSATANLAVGDTFGMSFVNRSSRKLWLTVILLDSGTATLLLPAKEAGIPQLTILPRDTLRYQPGCWVLTCEEGSDCSTRIKLIASSEPLDLHSLFAPSGQLRDAEEAGPTALDDFPIFQGSAPHTIRLWVQDLVLRPAPPFPLTPFNNTKK